jgi:hypothetical protein
MAMHIAFYVFADVTRTTSYQGYLTDDVGNPLTGTVDITFTIYDALVGGNQKWTETIKNVEVSDGLFNVVLGLSTPIDSDDVDSDRYLGIKVETDPEMTPR